MSIGVLQDDACLGQLHHERALAVKDVVSCSNPESKYVNIKLIEDPAGY
jgi:hypothetical protein